MTGPVYSSVGSLIIDNIRFEDGREQLNILGGAGIFAIYGMRLWQPRSLSKSIGYVVQKGFDYPESLDKELHSLEMSLIEKVHEDKPTTRGWNYFGAHDHRDFEYVHPIIRTTPADYPDAWILSIRIAHIISSADRAIDIVNDWRKRETALNKTSPPTDFIWEPLPWACLPENLEMACQAAKMVNILSPNHEEAAALLGLGLKQLINQHGLHGAVEYCARQLFEKTFCGLPGRVIVIRTGKHGAAVVHSPDTTTKGLVIRWIPAYWKDPTQVQDVTGAGNAFCGGYAVGWIETNKDPMKSCLYGAVSASYAVEQVGVPVRHGDEQWNQGPSPSERLATLQQACHQ
ncbi:Ribokinase-like protein [Radiomyces spectabilis]|uniref:Ribokinase-like protein n=1 Tax=Radiomyces spectabilis TaxID=64574 RepID=UPI00221FCAD3|nr:Ribokinase-like protein [Radiomyces spectabilis]KAI8393299.1 Ribokinase-like protein [Radiomyces spectabilis]